MSVPVQTPYKKYTAAAAATVFPTTFRVVLAGDLQVTVDSVVVTTGFTLSALGLSAGVDVTFTTPMVGGEVVELQRIIPKSRVTDYQQLGDFNAATVNADLDRAWMSIQELGEVSARTVKVPIGSALDPDQLIADLLAVQAAADDAAAAAAASQAAAADSAVASAASAAMTNLPPVVGKALNTLRVKSDETGYETRTPLETAADLGLIYTGFVVSTDDDIAPSGWVMSSGRTIGNAASGATERANADTAALFAMYWRTRNNTLAPIQDSAGVASTRGASAAADFAANKRMPLPDRRGRVDAGKDDMGGTAASRLTTGGSGVAGTTLGAVGGGETHTLTTAQIPSHSHGQTSTSTGGGGNVTQKIIGAVGSETPDNNPTSVTGGGGAHPNVQPTYVSNKIIKL